MPTLKASFSRFRYRLVHSSVVLTLALGFGSACGSDGSPKSSSGGAGEEAGGDTARGPGDGGADGDGESGGSSGKSNGGKSGGSTNPSEAGSPADGSAGDGAGGDGPAPYDPTETSIPPSGGEVALGDDGGSITVPSGAFTEDTVVTIEPAALPDTAPGSVEAVVPGFSVDFGDSKPAVAAKARVRLPYEPTEGDLVILVITDAGTRFVQYTLDTEGGVTYAVFDVSEGGRYLPVRLKQQPGCDETLPSAPTIATQADVDKLAKVRRIVGGLSISGSTVTSLAKLKCLQQVDGSVAISSTSLTSLEGLGNLTFVGTNYYLYGVQVSSNSLLESAELPSLLAVGANQQDIYYSSTLQIQSNPVLAAFSADALESAGLTFTGNGAAATDTTLSLAALRRAPALTIQQNPSLKDLDGLGKLGRVVGALNITNNGLTNLDGLGALESAGDVTVSNNVALTSAAGLSGVKRLGTLAVANNQLLKSLELPELVEMTQPNGSSISVTQNAGLTALAADKLETLPAQLNFSNNGNASVNTSLSFKGLKSVGGAISISNNLGLQSLAGLDALTSAKGITIQSNAALKDITGLNELTIADSLSIVSNAKMTAISGFTKLARLDHNLSVSQNTLLKTAAFPALATMGSDILVGNNAALTDFSADALRIAPANVSLQSNGTAGTPTKFGFAALTSIAGQLYVYSNPGLQTLGGFGALTSVGSNVNISYNAALANISSLTKLATVTGALTVSSNAALTSVSPLSALNRVTGSVTVTSNTELLDVILPALTSAAGVTVSSNPALVSVKLDALSASSGALQISNNGSAAAVTTTTVSFAALTAATGFTVSGNPKLKALNGFPLLSGISGPFYVYNNVLLPNCSIVALRNQIQQNGAISGTITISNNLVDGCATS